MRVGELFAGYSGLGMGLKLVYPDAEVAWVSEIDPGACKVLAHRLPELAGRDRAPLGALLPTPAVNDMGAGKTPDEWDAWTAKMQAKHGNGNGHGASLAIEVQRLLPTPRATDGTNGGPNQRGSSGDLMLPSAVARLLPTPSAADAAGGHHSRSGDRSNELLLKGVAHHDRWGDYAEAIARWESLTRPAPPPTEINPKNGRHRLSPRFEEWMMGLPDGWITDVPGVTWQEAVRMCGNGVVPQQAAAGIAWCLSQIDALGGAA